MVSPAERTDPVAAVLGDFSLKGIFSSTSELSAPWGIELPALPRMVIFHLLTEGRAIVDVEGETHPLRTGELMLLPHGTGHRILSAPGAPPTPLWQVPRVEETERYDRMRLHGGGEPARLVCGAVSFADPALGRLLAGLPPALLAATDTAWMRACFDVIAREARDNLGGSGLITARLADVLLVHAVRDGLARRSPETGWLAALRDDRIGPALRAIHDAPAHPWTLASLAAIARQSRSGFAARFSALLGEAPMSYVTAWRLDLAARLLREEESSVAGIAARVGYSSEPAFHRAFTRRHNVTPGAWRRSAGDPVATARHAFAAPA